MTHHHHHHHQQQPTHCCHRNTASSCDHCHKDEGCTNCLCIIVALFLPPLGVGLKFGCKVETWLCFFWTLMFIIPGYIYAIYAIAKED